MESVICTALITLLSITASTCKDISIQCFEGICYPNHFDREIPDQPYFCNWTVNKNEGKQFEKNDFGIDQTPAVKPEIIVMQTFFYDNNKTNGLLVKWSVKEKRLSINSKDISMFFVAIHVDDSDEKQYFANIKKNLNSTIKVTTGDKLVFSVEYCDGESETSLIPRQCAAKNISVAIQALPLYQQNTNQQISKKTIIISSCKNKSFAEVCKLQYNDPQKCDNSNGDSTHESSPSGYLLALLSIPLFLGILLGIWCKYYRRKKVSSSVVMLINRTAEEAQFTDEANKIASYLNNHLLKSSFVFNLWETQDADTKPDWWLRSNLKGCTHVIFIGTPAGKTTYNNWKDHHGVADCCIAGIRMILQECLYLPISVKYILLGDVDNYFKHKAKPLKYSKRFCFRKDSFSFPKEEKLFFKNIVGDIIDGKHLSSEEQNGYLQKLI